MALQTVLMIVLVAIFDDLTFTRPWVLSGGPVDSSARTWAWGTMGGMRVSLRVRPGASRTAVGGSYGEGPDARLVVAVSERAVDGAATKAVLRAVAKAFGVRPREVELVSGATSRDKVVAIDLPDDDVRARLAELLHSP